MAIPDEIPKGSLEFMSVDLESVDDLTTATVVIGLSPDPLAEPADWLPAEWPTPGVNEARTSALIDTSTYALGHYKVWARVSDSPEVLPRPYGIVRIV